MQINEYVIIVSLIGLLWQTYLLRREHNRAAIRDLYNKWNQVSNLEIEYPDLHKMLMPKETLESLKDWDEKELKKRALALVVFDVFSMLYQECHPRLSLKTENYLKKKIPIIPKQFFKIFFGTSEDLLSENESYICKVMSNPEMTRMWKEGELGKTWENYKFKDYIDSLLKEKGKMVKIINDSNSKDKEDQIKLSFSKSDKSYISIFYQIIGLAIILFYFLWNTILKTINQSPPSNFLFWFGIILWFGGLLIYLFKNKS